MSNWTPEGLERALDRAAGTASRSQSADRKRLRIVQAATELFIRQGYRKTSVDEVAAHCGVAKATVYLYVRNKADLLIQAIIEEKRRSMALFAPILAPDLPPRERLRCWVRESIALIPQLPLTAQLLSGNREFFAVLEELEFDQRIDTTEMQLDLMRELVAAAIAPVVLSPEVLTERARVLLALVTSLLTADERIRGDLPLDRYADLMAELVVNGILTPGPVESSRALAPQPRRGDIHD